MPDLTKNLLGDETVPVPAELLFDVGEILRTPAKLDDDLLDLVAGANEHLQRVVGEVLETEPLPSAALDRSRRTNGDFGNSRVPVDVSQLSFCSVDWTTFVAQPFPELVPIGHQYSSSQKRTIKHYGMKMLI